MLILGLLGVHGLMLSAFLWRIADGRSRLRFSHLLFAACLPFVGELCLLACELTQPPVEKVYQAPFRRRDSAWQPTDWQVPADWRKLLSGPEETARDFLLQVTRHQPEQRVEIYQAGLGSDNSEICHLCAAALQKEHDRHEDTIARAEAALAALPDNRQRADQLAQALRAYRLSGLPDTYTIKRLLKRETELASQAPAEERA